MGRHGFVHPFVVVPGEIGAKPGVPFRRSPETVPGALGPVQFHADPADGRDVTYSGADVNVGGSTQRLEFLLQARILLQRLDEGPYRVQRGGIHLVYQTSIPVRRKPGVDPCPIVPEVEVGFTHQEVVRSESVEGRQPTFRLLQVAGEGFHVGRTGGHDAPSEYADSAQVMPR